MSIDELIDSLFEIDDLSALDMQWLKMIKEFYASGGDIKNKCTKLDWELIHYAADNELKETIQWLVSNGANINSRNSQGWTPLLLALDSEIQNGIQNNQNDIDFSTTMSLLKLGADCHITTNDNLNLNSILESYGSKVKSNYEEQRVSMSK